MTASATNLDEAVLFQLARDKSVQGRTKLASIIADLFESRETTLTDRERSLMFGIMQGLVHDVEMSVRRSFVEQLATMTDAPRELVVELANDEIDVAYPLLQKSNLLKDSDLIDIVRLRTSEHQLAITLRGDISEDLSSALVDAGDDGVIESLLHNDNARISQATMEYLVEQSERVDTFQEPLLKRAELGENLAKRMFMWVSAALRQHIVHRFEISPEVVDELMEAAALREVTNAGSEFNANETAKLVAIIKEEGIIDANTLVAALSDGEVPLFVALLADMSRLREQLVRRIVFEEGGEGLAILCRAIGVPDMQFALIFRMSRAGRPGGKATVDAELATLTGMYRSMGGDAAGHVLNHWQRGTDYLAAVRELEMADMPVGGA